jgi:hypothetical protein
MLKTQKLYKFTATAVMSDGVFPVVESDWISATSYEEAETKFINDFMSDELLVEDLEEYGSVTVTHETLLTLSK